MSERPAIDVLFVSNGHGEDSIAAEIVKRLPGHIIAHAYPVIGEGDAFKGVCEIVGPRSFVPSQGWRHAKGSVLADFPAMLASVRPALSFFASAGRRYDQVVVVGDMVGVFLCSWARTRVDLYLDVFKTGQAHRYRRMELAAIRRTCGKVLCRDDILAAQLRSAGIDAVSHGNIMLDTVTRSPNPIPARPSETLGIGLLPGSRRTTHEAFAFQVGALRQVGKKASILGYLAVADGVDLVELASHSGLSLCPSQDDFPGAVGILTGPELRIIAYHRAAGNVIEAADIVLSQSGTATQQALGIGKPVITFLPSQHRKKRMNDEQALMGEARILVPNDVESLARELFGLVQSPQLRARLGKIGIERLGGRGTLKAVLELIETRATRARGSIRNNG